MQQRSGGTGGGAWTEAEDNTLRALVARDGVGTKHPALPFCFAETILLLLTEMWRVAGSWALKRRQLGWCAPSSAFVVPAVARISCAALIPRLVSPLLML